ncbi:MAG: DUF5723 family protein [Bacteroidetes bacterium]|nr:DUF5723 family protein [Bacteroidota bacterium]
MKKTIVFAALFLFPLLSANAQQTPSARLTSLGGLSTAVSTDVDAIGTNPANLLALSRGKVVVEFAPLTVGAGSDFLSLDLYNNYFTGQVDSAGNRVGRFLTESDKQSILNAFPGGLGTILTNVSVRDIGVAVRSSDFAIGFAVDERIGARATLPNSFVLFALDGNPAGSTYSWDNLGSKTWWYRTYNVDYAMRLPQVIVIPKDIAKDFTAGIGVKYVTGIGYASLNSNNSYLHTDTTGYAFNVGLGLNTLRAGFLSNAISKAVKSPVGDTAVNFNPFAAAGTGLGFDLGGTARVIDFIKVGYSVTDLGWITWSKNAIQTSGDTSFTFAGISPAAQGVPGSKSNVDSLNSALKDFFKNRDTVSSAFTTPLPTRLNIGASVEMDELFPAIPGRLLVAIDYHQGLNNSLGNSTVPEFVFGAEWKPISLFPIRTGLGFGGAYGFRWALGFGINLPFWDIDLGVGTFNAVVAPYSAKTVSVTLSLMKFRF